MAGETTVTLASPGKVELFLAPSATVQRVSVHSKKVPFTFHGGILSVDLGGTEGPAALTIAFRAEFNDQVAEHPSSSEEPTYGVSGAITSRGTFLGAGSHWYPTPPAVPLARSVRVEAPAGTEALTSGRRISHETKGGVSRSEWAEAHPVGELSLSAGPYRIAHRKLGEIDLYTYFYPDNASLSDRYLDAATRYITFYSALFGTYPFEKFAVVENFFPTGYGLPSYTLLGSTVIRLPFIINTSFPHEIAHSWWGNGIEADLETGNWSEGLVTYLADYLLKEKESPQEAREYRLQILSDYASLVTPEKEFPLRRFIGRVDSASRAIGYGKGAMLFHMVRRKIGDDPFFQALREVRQKRMYGTASWDDFIAAFSRAGGKDLAPFMKQWLERPGGPKLSLANATRSRSGSQWQVAGTVQQARPTFELEVPVRVEGEREETGTVVQVAASGNPFTLSTKTPPSRLLLDPGAEVFRLLSQAELPPTVNRLKGARGVVTVVTKGCRAKPETLKLLLRSLDQGDSIVLYEENAGREILAANDLLICGEPAAGLLPALPREVSVSRGTFTVQGEEFSGGDDLLFLVRENRLAPGKIAALFLPLSESAADKYVQKITHYGKYGYLLFSGGGIKRKGSFAPPPGPSVVEFE
ncbi:M1 family peptidase [Geomonas sp. RF6]|uniref:M1 family metallopeptidase n=1 Tax=Geomonas sp. RF6 TaxID=2897342 RepID=UPI001E50AA39|nr:M1 family aminopeptidase [Geomonas sp. RF6]UFS69874.1 M1 family peptidase [Geomonas sp. RF6]